MGNGIPNLAAIRGSRGVSLRQIAESTRIGIYYLQAIEGGAIDKLPPGIYRRSYIRQYARAIEYDEIELLRHFSLEPDTAETSPPPAPGSWVNRVVQLFRPVPHGRTEGSQ